MARSYICDTAARRNGFTLLEMSIVLAIIAIIIAGGLTVFSASLQKDQREETRAKLAAIQQALYNYRIANGRIPCPADVTIAIGNTNFGVEASPPGNCESGPVFANFQNVVKFVGGQTTQRSAIVTNIASTAGMAQCQIFTSPSGCIPNGDTILSVDSPTQITLAVPATCSAGGNPWITLYNVEGIVPVKTLQLPDDDAIDGWGRRIMYAVDARFTAANAFSTNPVVDGTPNCPTPYAARRMQVNDASGNVKTTAAAYVLLSFGPNGHGAFPRGSGTANLTIPGSRISTGSANADELSNCDCNSATPPAAQNKGGIFGYFVQKMPTQDAGTPDHTNDFDDVVLYGTRADLRSPTE